MAIILEEWLAITNYMKLDSLKPGEKAIIKMVGGERQYRRRLLDMGVTPGTKVILRKIAPFGDPIEITIRGYELTLRKNEAALIEVEKK